MAIWYRLNRFDYSGRGVIEPVEVEKETANFVVINGNRNAKVSEYASFFKTWGEAHNTLLARERRKYEAAVRALESAKRALADAEAMTNPGATP